jgi:hypothetical protein
MLSAILKTQSQKFIDFVFGRIPQHRSSVLLYLTLYLLLSHRVDDTLGFSNMFRDIKGIHGETLSSTLNSPALWTNAYLMFLCGAALMFPWFEQSFKNFDENSKQPAFFQKWQSWRRFSITLLFFYAILFVRWLKVDDSEWVGDTYFFHAAEIWRGLIGAMIGALLFAISAAIAIWVRLNIRSLLGRLFDTATGSDNGFLQFLLRQIEHFVAPQFGAVYKNQHSDMRRRFIEWARLHSAGITLGSGLFFIILLPFSVTHVITVVALFSLVALVFMVLMVLGAYQAKTRAILGTLVAGTLAGLFYVNTYSAEFKHQFPGFQNARGENRYAERDFIALDASPVVTSKGWQETCSLKGKSGSIKAQSVDLKTAMDNWKKHAQKAQGLQQTENPKMVVIATSGGAYRASFWTSLALDRIVTASFEDEMRGLAQSVRFITGASGGMVGGAYFAAHAKEEDWTEQGPPRANEITAALTADTIDAQRDLSGHSEATGYYTTATPIPNDTLSAVSQHILQVDAPALLFQDEVPIDRGQVLENHWLRLNDSFLDWAEGERAGWRPSLIVTPMVIETGQQLMISNLDLFEMERKLANDSRQLFQMAPCAQAHLSVKTAVRMNATFPYISPIVALPSHPQWRLVDAGYYDNFGITPLVNLLSARTEGCLHPGKGGFCLQDWLVHNTSGLLLIELHAFGEPELASAKLQTCLADKTTNCEQPQEGLRFLSGPLEAVLAARSKAMLSRNEHSLASLNARNPYARWETEEYQICRVTLANRLKKAGSLNWIMPPDELDELKMSLAHEWDRHHMQIREFWHDNRCASPEVDRIRSDNKILKLQATSR